jgi:hypothetical protein
MSTNYTLAQDLKEVTAMAKNFEEYIRGTELYGSSGGGFFSNLPSLTIGAYQMRLRRLDFQRDQLDKRQAEQLDQATAKFHEIEKEWNVHFSEKLLKELNSRLDAMKPYFQECSHDSRTCRANYMPEALRRTVVQELILVLENNRIEDADLMQKIKGTDGRLRGIVKPSDFIWSQGLQSVYPQSEYWWLYHRPPED